MKNFMKRVQDFGAKGKSVAVTALMAANAASMTVMCAPDTMRDLAGKLDIVINILWAVVAVVGLINLIPGIIAVIKAFTGGGQGQDSQALSEGIKKTVGGLVAIFVPAVISAILGGNMLTLATSMFTKYGLIS